MRNYASLLQNEFEDLDLSPLDFKPHIASQKFEQMVETARDLIRNGDMFQCVLSQRFSAEVTGNPFDFYRNLRVTNPSNYLYFYDLGIIKSSVPVQKVWFQLKMAS